jgi:hypothetical protein
MREAWNAEAMSVVDGDGSERAIAAELVRAFPAAIAGELVAWRFDRQARAGELTLNGDGGTSLVTAPSRLYPEGLAAHVTSGDGCARWDATAGVLLVGARGPTTVTFGPE